MPGQSCDVLIAGGLIVTLDRQRRVLENGSLAINGDRIAAVGPSTELTEKFEPRETLDARNTVIRPGYVDAHVHVTAEMLCRGFVPDSVGQREWIRGWASYLYPAMTAHEEYVAAQLASIELLRNGTTAFFEGGTIKDVGMVAQAIEQAGLRGVLGRWTWDLVPEPAAVRQTTDEALAATEDMAERFDGRANGRIRTMAAVINAETVSDRLLQGLSDMAKRRRMMLNFHQSGYYDYLSEARQRWGVSPIQHLADLEVLGPHLRLVHMNHVEDAELDLLHASDTRIVHCPGTAFRLAYGASTHGKFPEMLAAGLTVGLGTDGANAGDQLDMSRPIYLAAGLFKDARRDPTMIPAETALEMATIHGARSIGWGDEIGSLEAGKKADVVLLRRDRPEMTPLINVANALVYAADGRSVDTVLVDGKVVVRHGHLTTLDENEVYAEVNRLAPGLIARSGLPLQRRWPVVS